MRATITATITAAVTAALLACLLAAAPPADAKRKPKKYGPVCAWVDRKHKGCIVVLAPPWAQPDDIIVVTPTPEAK